MEGWFVEVNDGLAMMVRVKEKIFDYKGFQHIQIFETEFGKMLVLDGKIQLTEKDEKSYHEMLVHVPMLMHENPSKVLIIGGGDGGSVREVLKHEPDEIIMVEIDKGVVEACRRYLSIDEGALNDPRLKVLYDDGVNFVKNARKIKKKFDVLIVNGTDPGPLSQSLFARMFYEACAEITDYFVTQSQSPALQPEYFKEVIENTNAFVDRRVYLSFVPMYPTGMWSFLLASNRKIELDLDEIRRRYEERGLKTYYYTPEIHIASFALPRWIKEIVESV
jgi:spermidine synthase